MPAPMIKSFAKKQGLPIAKVEKYWDKAKGIVKKKLKLTEKDDNFYKVVVGVVKKMCGIKEGKWIDDFEKTWVEVDEMERQETSQLTLEIIDILLNEGRKPTEWVDKAGKKWSGEKMSAAEMARKGGVSTVAVTKGIKGVMDKIFKNLRKSEPDVPILLLATIIAKQLGISSSADFVDFKKTLPDWVKKEIGAEAKKRKLVKEDEIAENYKNRDKKQSKNYTPKQSMVFKKLSKSGKDCKMLNIEPNGDMLVNIDGEIKIITPGGQLKSVK